MSQQKIIKCLILTILMGMSFSVHAKSDSTRIGIRVEIKATQNCDYSYALENKAKLKYANYVQFSDCGISTSKVQLQADQIAISEFKTTQPPRDGKRLRVFMTVQ